MTNTVSCRAKSAFSPISEWLKQYDGIDVTGVFGFYSEYSPLYGGRIYNGAEITAADVDYLTSKNISLKLTLTSNKVSESHYQQSKALLDKYHKKGNSVAIVNDDLAKWIRRDYPDYLIEGSVIKNTKFSQIDETLKLYDTVVLPMYMNDDVAELDKIKQKDKIILFGNAGCAYNCPSKICYPSIAKINKGADPSIFKCSQSLVYREQNLIHWFDIKFLKKLGFDNYKWLTTTKGFGY